LIAGIKITNSRECGINFVNGVVYFYNGSTGFRCGQSRLNLGRFFGWKVKKFF
jgi:hypothetical protein